METTSNNSSAAQMTINLTDIALANDVKRLLRHISGIESITVHRIKNEVELSLEEAKSGKTTSWSSVDDYFKTMQQ